jgi:ABC-type sugar transport system permease subunit
MVFDHGPFERMHMKKRNQSLRFSETKDAYTLLLPLLLLIVLFIAIPVFSNFVYSLTKWNGVRKPVFIGLDNYRRMFQDERFFSSLKNLLILIAYIPIGVFLPLLLSSWLRDRLSGWKMFRGILYLPNILGPVLLGTLFSVILSQVGPLTALLKALNVKNAEAFFLLGKTNGAINTLAFLFVIWMRLGFGCFYFVSAMSNISQDLYDAADVDGARPWQKFIHITIPSISFSIQFFTVLAFIEVFARMYGLIFTLTNGGPGYATYTLEYAVYNISFNGMQKGYAAAWSVALFFGCAIIALFQLKLMKRNSQL